MAIDRRTFLATSGTGIALLIGIGSTACWPRRGRPGDAAVLGPNRWLRIDEDGWVTVVNDKSEMGQGAATVVPAIVADELGVPLDRVRVEHALPSAQFDDMGTSGSDTVASRWRPLRSAAAAAREVLIAAAAARWSVPTTDCRLANGLVTDARSRRTIAIGELVGAARSLPIPAQPTLKPDGELTLAGTRIGRLDGAAAVRGAKIYGIDHRVPGMLHAVLARCPSASGRLTRWSGERAKQVPGVRQVVETASGIAVVADTTWAALQGRKALDLEWDQRAGVGVDSASLWSQLADGFGRLGKQARREGDPERALRQSCRRLEAEYRYPFQAHAAVEPLNAIVSVGKDGCDVWVGTQNPNRAQRDVAQRLGMAPERVRIHVLPLGGAFGRRIDADFVVEAADVAQAAGAPVQLVWSREDDFAHDKFQSAAIVRMAAGLGPAGEILAWSHQIADFHLTMFGAFDPATFKPAEEGEPWGGIDTPYRFPALDVRIARQSPPVATGAWRSVFYPSSVLARESFLDEVAHETGQDPLALRLALLPSPAGAPPLDRPARLRRVLETVAAKGGWNEPLPDHGSGRKVGRGLAATIYHQSTVVANLAEVSVGPGGDIAIHRIVCALDCGRAVNLDGVEAQIEGGTAWALSTLLGREITFREGRVEQQTYEDFPVLRIDRMPRVEAHVLESPNPPFGVGEQPVPTVMPAVLNAVFRATGRRIRRVPLSAAEPERRA